jgi:hypothetical protein
LGYEVLLGVLTSLLIGEGNALNSKLEICSTPLLELLRSLIDYYPGPEFDLLRWEDTVGDTVTFSEPYMMLFTHRAELNQSLDTDLPAETKSHVSLLLQFLREEMPRASAKLDEIEAGTAQKISFQDLWLLYTPNTPVYSLQDDRQVVVYSRNNPEKNLKGQFGVLSLYCWSSIYKSNRLVREFYPWVIQPYTGEKSINQLDLIPTQYLQKRQALGERLIARGNQYFELNKKAVLQDYTGNQFPRVFKDEPIRVVVDQHTYWRTVGVETRTEDPSEEYGFPAGEESLEDESGNPLERALVCCYPRVGVYSLRDREWALVDVDDLQPVQFREKAFKRLVIKDEYKKLITAMVQAYMLEQPGFSDIVAGKGRGLIVLLHGPRTSPLVPPYNTQPVRLTRTNRSRNRQNPHRRMLGRKTKTPPLHRLLRRNRHRARNSREAPQRSLQLCCSLGCNSSYG